MTDLMQTLQKPGSADWYSMASYGFPVEDMLSTSSGLNLGRSQDVPGFSLPALPSMPGIDALLQQKPEGLWDRFTQGIKGSGIVGGTNADGTKFDGWGSPAIGLLQALNAFGMGNRQLKLSESMVADARKQFAMNYGAQRQTLNTQMEDRQRTRVAANPNRESVESYMSRNRIK
jgi:hypothetical protein